MYSSDSKIETSVEPRKTAFGRFPNTGSNTSSLARHAFQRRAWPALDRDLVLRDVALIDHRGLGQDFLRGRLLVQRADRDLGAQAAVDQAIVVAARQHVAGLDEVDRLLAGIDADDQRLLLRVLERLDGAERHGVVGGQHAVDLLV